jgi:hypothetical protein
LTTVGQGTYQGYSFLPASKGKCLVPNSSDYQPAAITIEFRVRLDLIYSSQTSATPIWIFNFATGSGFGVFFSRATGGLTFRLVTAAGTTNFLVNGIVNTWNTSDVHHIAVTYDGAFMKTFEDGVEKGSLAKTGAIIHNITQPLLFNGPDSSTPSAGYVNGFLDEIRIWDYARTDVEITADMASELVGTESGLVGLWKFDEDSGTVALDSTAFANNGTLVGHTSVIINFLPDPNAINFSVNQPDINLIVYPDPAVATFTAKKPLIILVAPTPIVANFTANPVKVNRTIHAEQTTISFVVSTPTIRLISYATPSVITLSNPPPTIVMTINPTPAIANFSVNDPRVNLVIYPEEAIANFSVNDPRVNLVIYPEEAIANFSVNDPRVNLVIYPEEAIANFSVNDVVINQTILPIPVTISFSANGVIFSYVLYPDPEIIIFSVPDPTVTNTPPVNITIHFTVKIFNVINYQVIIENS